MDFEVLEQDRYRMTVRTGADRSQPDVERQVNAAYPVGPWECWFVPAPAAWGGIPTLRGFSRPCWDQPGMVLVALERGPAQTVV